MKHFTYEEMELMSIYDPGTREGLIANLEEMRGFLEPDEDELRELTDSARRPRPARSMTFGTNGCAGMSGAGPGASPWWIAAAKSPVCAMCSTWRTQAAETMPAAPISGGYRTST